VKRLGSPSSEALSSENRRGPGARSPGIHLGSTVSRLQAVPRRARDPEVRREAPQKRGPPRSILHRQDAALSRSSSGGGVSPSKASASTRFPAIEEGSQRSRRSRGQARLRLRTAPRPSLLTPERSTHHPPGWPSRLRNSMPCWPETRQRQPCRPAFPNGRRGSWLRLARVAQRLRAALAA
jgi:hypothetical protein